MAKKKKSSEIQLSSEVQEAEKTGKITLEEYLQQVKVSPLLVASFRYEGAHHHPDMLEPKTLEEWAESFRAQSTRIYH